MTNELVSPEIGKTAEGKFIKLKPDEPVKFVLYKPVEILEAVQGDNLKFFREVTMNGVTKHIKYVIHLKEVLTNDIKEWQVGSAASINQLTTLEAGVGDMISIEKIKLGERPQDVRYRIKLEEKASGAATEATKTEKTPPPPPEEEAWKKELKVEDIPL